jgi:hypothetical protein
VTAGEVDIGKLQPQLTARKSTFHYWLERFGHSPGEDGRRILNVSPLEAKVSEPFWINKLNRHNGGCGASSTLSGAAGATKEHHYQIDFTKC